MADRLVCPLRALAGCLAQTTVATVVWSENRDSSCSWDWMRSVCKAPQARHACRQPINPPLPTSQVILLLLLHCVGEPVFVSRPCSSAEDDGVVVAPGVDADGNGFMLVMDAATWTETACVQLTFGVPNRFHGIWLSS